MATRITAPLSGSVTNGNWVAQDINVAGVTLPSGKPVHFCYLLPAQYDKNSFLYPIMVWLHPDQEANGWYQGQQGATDMCFADADGFYNNSSFRTNYPSICIVGYADQTTDSDAIQNWGGWVNNGTTGTGTHFSGDSGPNTFGIIGVVQWAIANLGGDPNRVYVSGFSLGGIGAEYLMLKYNQVTGNPKVFTSGMSTGGVLEIHGYGAGASAADLTAMQGVPTWWVSGANDGTSVPADWNLPTWRALAGNSNYPGPNSSAAASQAGNSGYHLWLDPNIGHQQTNASGAPYPTNTTILNFMYSQVGGVAVQPTTVPTPTVPNLPTPTVPTIAVPSQASAVGFNTLTYGPNLVLGTTPDPVSSFPQFTNGANIVPFTFFGNSWLNVGVTRNSDGSLSMDGSGQNYGNGLCTAAVGNYSVSRDPSNFTGIAFGGGGYFEAVFKGNGPMSFWANDIENMNGTSLGNPNAQWPGQASGYGDWIETDIAEFDYTGVLGWAIHNWYGNALDVTPNWGGPLNGYNGPPAGVDYTQYNKYGMLWVPATSSTPGYIKIFFNNQQVSNTLFWNKYNPADPPPPVAGNVINVQQGAYGNSFGQTVPNTAWSVLDTRHLAIILGGATGSVVTFKSISVWQPSAANNVGTLTQTPTRPTTPTATPTVTTASGGYITPTSGGTVTDAAGNVWSLDTAGNLVENGNLVTGGAGTSALTVVSGTIWAQDANSLAWYTFDGTNFNAANGTPPVPPTVPTTPTAIPTVPTRPTPPPTPTSPNPTVLPAPTIPTAPPTTPTVAPTAPTTVPTAVPTRPTPTTPTTAPTAPTTVPTVPTSVPTSVPTVAPTPTRPTTPTPTAVPPVPTLPTPVGTTFVNYPLATTQTHITLTGLQPNTAYDFDIVATNNLGSSVSPFITVLTQQGSVPTVPTIPTRPSPTVPTVTTAPTPTVPTIAPPTESASGTQIAAGSGRIVDSTGIIWTVTTSAQVAENGSALANTQSVSLMYYSARVVYYRDTSNNWYAWNGTGFAATSSPLASPTAPTLPTPSVPTPIVPTVAPTPTRPTPTVPTPTVPTVVAGTGQFFIQNGKIYDPQGNLFIARGLNADGTNTASTILSLFPNINFVRFPIGGYDSASGYTSFVNTMTARKVVVEPEYHPWPLQSESPSGNYQGFIQDFVTTFKNNPYVWMGSLNEPQSGNMSSEHQNVYNWTRAIDPNKMCMFVGGIGGGNPNNTGIAVLNKSTYASMKNIVWDLHYYGWVANGNTDQTTNNNDLLGNTSGSGILSLNQITSADGKIPIINGEFGPSTTGEGNDANANQVIQAVTVWAVTNNYTNGYAGWGWDQDQYNALQNNGTRTSWGNQLNSAMAATATYAGQQSGVPTPPSAPTSPTTTTTPTVTTGGGGYVTPTSGGSVQDAAGNTYTLDSAGNLLQNGAAITGGAGTGAITVVNGTLWAQDGSSGTWYTFNGTNFTSQGSTVPPAATPTTPTRPTPTVPTVSVPTTTTPTVPVASGSRKWYQVIGGDRSLTTTPFQTTATWITSGTLINQLRGLTFANVRSFDTTGFVSPFWVSLSTSDPLCTFHDSTGTIADFQMRVPVGAYSENGSTGAGDNSAGFIDSNSPYKYVTINDCRIGTNSGNASAGGVVSASNNFIMCGPGNGSPGGMIVQDATGPTLIDAVNHSINTTIWENGDNVSGCITYYDLQQCNANANYVVQHLIGVNLGLNAFSSSGQILWPLVIGDVPGTGSIPEGCIIGIPASTARPTGKSRGFYVLFDLFQHFGGMFNNATQNGQIGIKTMPRDSATASLVADMLSQFGSVVQYLCILNYTTGMAGAQYGLTTLKGRLANATGWSDAFPAPPTLDFSQTGGVSVAPGTFGAWQAANGIGVCYSTNWNQTQASTGITVTVPTLVHVPTTWFKAANITLSNNNMTATSTGSTTPGSLPQTVHSTNSLTSGKVYFEVTMQSSTKDFAVGLITQGYNFASKAGIGSDANSLGYYPISPVQAIYINNKQLTNGPTPDVSGAVLSFAVDFGAKMFWASSPAMRKVGHPWNNTASANPATGVGGVAMAGQLAPGPYFIAYNNLEGGGTATLNAGGGRFAQSVPSGFTAWDGVAIKSTAQAIAPPMVPPESITWCDEMTLPNMRWVGNSDHVSVYYDTDSYTDADGISICNQFLAAVETYYQTLVSWFNGYAPNNSNGLVTIENPTGGLINYFIVSNGSFQAGHCSCINADILVDFASVDKTNIDAVFCEFLLELSEVFMPSLSALPDCDTYALGEGMSNAMAIDLRSGGIGTTVANLAVQWMNETVNGRQRGDFVNVNAIFNTTNAADDTRLVAAGCATVFFLYLRYQLLYTWQQITAALDTLPPQSTLAQLYVALDNTAGGDPFPAFVSLLNSKYAPVVTIDTQFSPLHLFPI